jgi:hypothetical protein
VRIFLLLKEDARALIIPQAVAQNKAPFLYPHPRKILSNGTPIKLSEQFIRIRQQAP